MVPVNSPMTSRGESQLSELFQTLNPPLSDNSFADIVVQRIRRRLWLRRIVLSTAILVGGILSLGPVSELVVLFSQTLLAVATRWNDPMWLMENQTLVVEAVLILVWPGVLRLLEK